MDLYLGATLKAEVLVLSKSNRTCTQEMHCRLSPPQTESWRLRIETSELSEDPTPYYRFIEISIKEKLSYSEAWAFKRASFLPSIPESG